jgi:hypothetical protein
MIRTIREALASLSVSELNEIAAVRDVSTGRTRAEKLRRLSAHFRGDWDEFIESCKVPHLKKILSGYFVFRNEVEVRFTNLSRAKVEELADLLRIVAGQDEWDGDDGDEIVGPITARVTDLSDEDEEEEFFDSDDDDSDDEDDEEEDEEFEFPSNRTEAQPRWHTERALAAGPGVPLPAPLARSDKPLYDHQHVALRKLDDWWRGDAGKRAGFLVLLWRVTVS